MKTLDVPRRLLMGSGPSNPEPRVLRALAVPPLAPDDPAREALLDDVAHGIGAVFQAPNACGRVLGGASRSGIEAALASTIAPGDRVLVGAYGHFGELLCTLAQRHGAAIERLDAEWGNAIDPERICDAIRRTRPKVVAIVHADTSTGVLQPLDGIGAACHEVGAVFVVDAVLSMGGCEVAVESWQVDIAIAGLQKCLGGPPGLALLTLSDRAQRGFVETPRSAYLDLRRVTNGSVPHMLFAAREALRIVLEEGLEARWQRHASASRALRAGLEAMGLALFTDPLQRVPMITLVPVPGGMDEAAVRGQLLEQHGIEIMAAFGPLLGRVWRIGTMGTNASLPSVLAVLGGLEAVLAARGMRLPRGAAVDAALAAYGLDPP